MTQTAILALGYVVLFFTLCHAPVLPLVRLLWLPVPDKWHIALCYMAAFFKSLLVLPADLLAPVVVPIALLFTKWEDDRLPRLFTWWDNDASINGDRRTDDPADGLGGWALVPVPLEDTPVARALAYYAAGHHPRSFYARFVWLGLRNRASKLSQMLGVNATGYATTWSGDGWHVTRCQGYYRYYEMLKVGPMHIRMHCGYKVPGVDGLGKQPPVSIGFSLRR